ncbi:MAE_28990/MAE_18760 family HEPN-like nuclease [Listeria innocua]|uniref:MAE_28990/MAE_18760 family HEPN-like nuclease n=1 Tax=Listeria innocua TaxID=1642 RepID=UPI001272B4DB|nr:MAE_28990/MAE_18760 family HEPN-like nuclease [Listeria innocua]EAG1699268.1 hypothetical protein [Listeria monocytogenes]MBC1367935.1 hypothetical protein [Listeria innocua]MBC1407983.1 hypothetical protein [Listeria innocua]
MKKNFETLTQEIDRFLEVLKDFESTIIGSPSTCSFLKLDIKDKDESEAIFKSLKSNMMMMLYNLTESTIRLTMNFYYDNFNKKRKNYSNTVENLRKTWIKHSLGVIKPDNIQKQVYDMIESIMDVEYTISLEFENFSLSGNADLRELKGILNTHGLIYDDNQFKIYGGSLKTVKEMRNSLAHGNISFEENGKNLSVSDLTNYKNETYACLLIFIEVVENNINEQIE